MAYAPYSKYLVGAALLTAEELEAVAAYLQQYFGGWADLNIM
jgi:hypothetical protein